MEFWVTLFLFFYQIIRNSTSQELHCKDVTIYIQVPNLGKIEGQKREVSLSSKIVFIKYIYPIELQKIIDNGKGLDATSPPI